MRFHAVFLQNSTFLVIFLPPERFFAFFDGISFFERYFEIWSVFPPFFAIWTILVDYFITFPRFSVFAVFSFFSVFFVFLRFYMGLAGLAWPPSCLSLSVSCWLGLSLLVVFNTFDGLFVSFSFLPTLSVLYSLRNALFGRGLPFFPEINRNCRLLDRSVLERSSVDRPDVLMFFRSNFDVSGCFPMISETICFARFVTS